MTERENNKKILDESLCLKRSEMKFQILFENSPLGMTMVNHETGAFLEVNQALLDMIGYSREELLQLTFWAITPEKYNDQEAAQHQSLNETGRFGPNEKEYIRKDGTLVPIRLSGFRLMDADGEEVVWGIIEDISERKAMEEELVYLATHDALTDLANRRLFNERLAFTFDYCHREQKRFAVLVLDIDKLKSVNDCYGHVVGDKLLIEFASRLKSVIMRKTDTIARTGGDEFMILLSLLSEVEDAWLVGSDILEAVHQPFMIEEHEIHVTVSIGISIYPKDGEIPERLVVKADEAAYDIKNTGGDGIKYYEG